MTQQSGNQFDDDLTVGLDDDGAFSTDSIDLFEFSGGEESPIGRLKTIILSIDWEINDDILQQLEDELADLADIWAGDKIKLVYVQGLSKIGKYIDKEKAAAHPNSIKLLITFYHNLERIVSADDEMSEDEKKELLIADVKKFDQLKSQIGKPSTDLPEVETVAPETHTEIDNDGTADGELKVLKAQVLGLDWEIDDKELEKLGVEINRLEGVYSDSKGKLILLQGIGALSSYIKKMKSQSNSKAFSLLHSFYEVLEQTLSGDLSPEEEKQRLLSEVEKFKSFKVEIANDKAEPEPAVSVVGPTSENAFEKKKEVLPVEDEDSEKVALDVESRLASVFGDMEDESDGIGMDKNAALEGVNVETDADDDSDEDALPFADGAVAPALSEVDEESSFSVEKLAGDLAQSFEPEVSSKEEIVAEEIIPGVDVESDADDDSDEDALPVVDGEIAPALSGSSDESGFDDSTFKDVEDSDSRDLDSKLGSFFDDEMESSSKAWGSEQEEDSVFDDDHVAALSGVTDDSEETVVGEKSNEEIDSDFLDDGAVTPALSESDGGLPFDLPVEDSFEEKLSFFDEEDDESQLDGPVQSLGEDDLSHDQEDEVQVSFLDDDISEDTDLGEFFEDDLSTEDEVAGFFDDGAPAAALSDSDETPHLDEEPIEDAVDEQFSLFDESDAKAEKMLFEEDADIEAVDDKLSFLDDETPAPALSDDVAKDGDDSFLEEISDQEDDIEAVAFEEELPVEEVAIDEVAFEEELPVEEDVVEEIAFEEESPVEEDDIEDVAFQEEVSVEKEKSEEDISFIAEEPDSAEIEDEDEESVSISVEEEHEELLDTDEIEFTVPGEAVATGVLAAAGAVSLADDKESFDDVIDFQVPGEDDSTGISLDITEATEDEIVVFEVVGDEVEVDPLPGEEYADNSIDVVDEDTLEFSSAEEADSQPDSITVKKDESVAVDYSSLSEKIQRMQGEVTDTNLQALFSETNKARIQSTSNTTGKIFLQLLSTINQYVERNIDDPDPASLALMDDVYSGLQMSASADASTEQIQQQLLTCTSQVILLQQKNIVKADATLEPVDIDVDTGGVDDSDLSQKAEIGTGAPISMGDDQLVSFVQGELADIKKLFLDEIRTLRKEVVEK